MEVKREGATDEQSRLSRTRGVTEVVVVEVRGGGGGELSVDRSRKVKTTKSEKGCGGQQAGVSYYNRGEI